MCNVIVTWLMQDISTRNNFRESDSYLLDNFNWLSRVKVLMHFMVYPIYYLSLINSLDYSSEIKLLDTEKTTYDSFYSLYTWRCGKLDFLLSFIVNAY